MSLTSTTTKTPVISIDPWSVDVLREPTEFQDHLREAGPVVYLEKYGVFAMGRYEHVHAALSSWQIFESGAGVGLANWKKEKPWRPLSIVNEVDPPHHDAPRHAIMKILTPRAIGSLNDSWETDAEELVDSLLARTSEFDLISELAAQYPIRVFPDALGVGKEGRENFIPYSEHAFNSFGPMNHLVEQRAKQIPEIVAWVTKQCERDSLTPGSFGAQLYEAADRGEIVHEHVPLLIRSLITAGVDTTIIGLGIVLTRFAQQPEIWEKLRARPQLIRHAFDEALRLESPVQTLFRTTSQEIEIEGTVIPKDSKVYLSLAAANRDPRRWDNPDTFDIDRDLAGHMGFGMGIHHCVGQHIARMEAVALIGTLLKRVKSLELVGVPERHLNNTLRAWGSVPVRVERA